MKSSVLKTFGVFNVTKKSLFVFYNFFCTNYETVKGVSVLADSHLFLVNKVACRIASAMLPSYSTPRKLLLTFSVVENSW